MPCSLIADYLGFSVYHIRQRILCLPSFPRRCASSISTNDSRGVTG
jgi:hypothetical protein